MDSLAKQMTKRGMLKTLKSLPKELDKTYDHAMERIRSQDTEHACIAKQVLAWLSHAYRPLSVKELQHALAVLPGEVCTFRVLTRKKRCANYQILRRGISTKTESVLKRILFPFALD